MSAKHDAPAEEIIVVRRKSGGEDECHHGGVWKIAYADFMTAMMAFFLVMWLINAANTEVKASVASYFNPLRLTDNVAVKKGLRDMTNQSRTQANPGGGGKGESNSESCDPSKSAKDANASDGKDGAQEHSRRLTLNFDRASPAVRREEHDANAAAAELRGKAFRDPFNPLAPGSLVQEQGAKASAGMEERGGSGTWSKPLKDKVQEMAAADAHRQAALEAKDLEPPQDVSIGSRQPPKAQQAAPADFPERASMHDVAQHEGQENAAGHAKAEAKTRLAALREKVKEGAEAAIGKLGVNGGPGMDVLIEGDAVVLSLTDTSNFGMFSIGSADPRGELLELMRSVAPVVLANSEHIIVRGHTDARPYRALSDNNNWRLSMLRAEAAYELLLKAGVDEKRFERIEGYADRKPKLPAEPEAAVNRRIEIVLRPPPA